LLPISERNYPLKNERPSALFTFLQLQKLDSIVSVALSLNNRYRLFDWRYQLFLCNFMNDVRTFLLKIKKFQGEYLFLSINYDNINSKNVNQIANTIDFIFLNDTIKNVKFKVRKEIFQKISLK